MARMTIATRNYWLTLALMALVFMITIALTANSMAKVRGGDDEGSGFGGTGRSGDFDGSGFGGTGGPMPWFGYDEEGEKARRELDQLREDLRPIDLPETLRQSIDINLMRQRTELALTPQRVSPAPAPLSTDFADIERRMSEPQATLEVAQPELELITPRSMPVAPVEVLPFELATPGIDATETRPERAPAVELAEAAPSEPAEAVRAADKPEATVQVAVEMAVASESPVEQDNAGAAAVPEVAPAQQVATQLAESADRSDQKEERLLLPERIQRPELPPIQRMRPAVERITISPPRPQPMRI